MSGRKILLTGCACAALAACQANLAWDGPKTYTPPPAQTVMLDSFGINGQVDVVSGALPMTVTRNLTNTGADPVPPGYTVRDTVVQAVFRAVGGAAAWEVLPDPQYTRFICEAPGPALAPGQSAPVSFTIPGPQCTQVNPAPPAVIAALPCGMYLETLAADVADVVPETSEADNEGEHYFYVPSQTFDITLTSTPNPAPVNATVGRDSAEVVFNAPPGQTLWTVAVNTVPAGNPYVVNGRTPRVHAHSGDMLAIAPPVPAGSIAAPLTGANSFTITATPNAAHDGAQTNILEDFHRDGMATNISAFTTDGCAFRMNTYTADFLHPIAVLP